MQNHQFIGITGKIGAGKDTLAQWLQDNCFDGSAAITSFAAPLKQACYAVFGWSEEIMNNRTTKEAVDPFWGFSPRQAAQLLGTEGMRHLFGDDVWIKALQRRLDGDLAAIGTIIIPDVRFENEARFIREQGGRIIHMEIAADTVTLSAQTKAHASEQGVAFVDGDALIENNKRLGLPHLYEQFASQLAFLRPSHLIEPDDGEEWNDSNKRYALGGLR